MKISNLAKTGAVATAAALLITGCSGGGDDGGATAVMYSSANETTNGVITDAAAAQDPALTVDVVTGSSGPLLQRIETEAGSAAADVFFAAPGETLADYADVIAPYESPEAETIPEELRDPENRWTPANAHVVAFMANTDQIDGGEAPTSWEELTDPEWAGKITIADPVQSTTALTALYGAYKVLGEEGFADLASNLTVTENSGNVYPAVAQGEYALSIGYESNIYPYIAGEQPGIEMVYPEDGTFVAYDSVMAVKDSPDPEAAQQLIDTVLAKETQEQNLEQSFRRPSREDIDPTQFVEFERLEDLNVVDIDEEEDEQGREDFLAFWETV